MITVNLRTTQHAIGNTQTQTKDLDLVEVHAPYMKSIVIITVNKSHTIQILLPDNLYYTANYKYYIYQPTIEVPSLC